MKGLECLFFCYFIFWVGWVLLCFNKLRSNKCKFEIGKRIKKKVIFIDPWCIILIHLRRKGIKIFGWCSRKYVFCSQLFVGEVAVVRQRIFCFNKFMAEFSIAFWQRLFPLQAVLWQKVNVYGWSMNFLFLDLKVACWGCDCKI